MTRARAALLVCALALVAASQALLLAHHSFAVYYLESDTIEIEGDVVEFQYKNPHAVIVVQGTENSGFNQPKIYAAEWVSTSQLDRAGIEKTWFKAGDSIRIWAAPNKNPTDNRVHIKRMERRSDGWKWAGNRGAVR